MSHSRSLGPPSSLRDFSLSLSISEPLYPSPSLSLSLSISQPLYLTASVSQSLYLSGSLSLTAGLPQPALPGPRAGHQKGLLIGNHQFTRTEEQWEAKR